jgi:hypothetical protein
LDETTLAGGVTQVLPARGLCERFAQNAADNGAATILLLFPAGNERILRLERPHPARLFALLSTWALTGLISVIAI